MVSYPKSELEEGEDSGADVAATGGYDRSKSDVFERENRERSSQEVAAMISGGRKLLLARFEEFLRRLPSFYNEFGTCPIVSLEFSEGNSQSVLFQGEFMVGLDPDVAVKLITEMHERGVHSVTRVGQLGIKIIIPARILDVGTSRDQASGIRRGIKSRVRGV